MNIFDQFDQPQGANVFDRFDAQPADPRQPQELTFAEKYIAPLLESMGVGDIAGGNLRGSSVGGMMQGAADPVVGAVQTAANLLPDATGIPDAVNRRITEQNRQYEDARASAGREGVDLGRFAGNVLSPVNLLLAKGIPNAPTVPGQIGVGAGVGGVGGLMQPVYGAENGSFWAPKAGQIIGGAVTGAVLTPILSKAGDLAVRKLMAPNVAPGANSEQAISDALAELGQSVHDVPPAQLEALRGQVNAALQSGKSIDAVAALRKADFDALGIQPTLGQITRDPMQFARERNLRGVEGIGEPLTARFADQGNKLQARLAQPAEGAQDAYNAGNTLLSALQNTDSTLRNHVSGLYNEARQSAGKDLDVPLQGLAQDYAQTLSDFGDKIPGAVRAKFESLGLMGVPNAGNQARIFTLEDANKLLQNINAHVGSDPVTNRALGSLRDAVKNAALAADASGGPFAPAVNAARERFSLLDAVPALKAAANGDVAPDDFVRRFIVNGKTDDVKGLGQVLQQAAPDAWQQARAQIADTLQRAAYGENVAGDKSFAVERFNSTLRKMGRDKLGAFFSPQEVDELFRVGRVGGYVNQAPNAAAVSTSNSQAGLINVLANTGGRGAETAANMALPGSGIAVTAIKKMAGPVKGARDVRNALAAMIPTEDAPLGPEQANALRYIIGSGGLGAGALLPNRKQKRVERHP